MTAHISKNYYDTRIYSRGAAMQCVREQYKGAGADYTFSATKASHPVLTEVIF